MTPTDQVTLTTRQQAVLAQLQRRFPAEHCEAARQRMLAGSRATSRRNPQPPPIAPHGSGGRTAVDLNGSAS
jgi:hypothetical protein